MKRARGLFPRVVTFQNLLAAAREATRGKRYRPDVARFNLELEQNLLSLRQELREKTYRPGGYRTFQVREPKPRLISAAPFRDRVVHHALIRVLEPVLEQGFIFHSYACRRGKGNHKALRGLREAIQQQLWSQRLRLNERKSRIRNTCEGLTWLGFHVLPDQIRVKRASVRRWLRRLVRLRRELDTGRIAVEDVTRSVQAWLAHTEHGHCHRLCHDILARSVF